MANPAIKPAPTKVVTGKARLSYVHLFEPWAGEEGQEPKYSCCVLIPKSDKQTVAKINAAIEAVKADPASATKWGGKVPVNLNGGLRDGDTERDGEEYKGHWFINVNSKQKPGVVDQNVQPILDAAEVYSGIYARVSINFYAYNAAGNKGVGAGLGNVQKLADGAPLGGARARAEDEFDAIEDDDDFLN